MHKSVTKGDLNTIFHLHSDWLNSKGDEGKRADFSEIDLSGHSLRGHNLIKANFSNSLLISTDLTGCNCAWADFRWSDLTHSNLSKTDLRYSNFSFADLSETNLTGAYLKHAILKGVNISKAKLVDTILVQSRLIGIDFRNVKFFNTDMSGALLVAGKYINAGEWKDTNLTGVVIDLISELGLPNEIRSKFDQSFIRIQPFSIVRSIEFPDEYLHAGLTILNYFGSIVRKKHPTEDVVLEISQRGNTVTLVVETSSKHEKIIETTLDLYEQVVREKIHPEQFMHDDRHIVDLQNQLLIAKNQVEVYKNTVAVLEKRILRTDKGLAEFFKKLTDANHVIQDSIPKYLLPDKPNNEYREGVRDGVELAMNLIRMYLHDIGSQIISPEELVKELNEVKENLEKCCHTSEEVTPREAVKDTGLQSLVKKLEKVHELFSGVIQITEDGTKIIEKVSAQYQKLIALLKYFD